MGMLSLCYRPTTGPSRPSSLTLLLESSGTTTSGTTGPSRPSSLTLLLESPHILKLFFDCRRDAEALFFQFGVILKGCYDVQILYAFWKDVSLPTPEIGEERKAVDRVNGKLRGLKKAIDAYFEAGAEREAWKVAEKQRRTEERERRGNVSPSRSPNGSGGSSPGGRGGSTTLTKHQLLKAKLLGGKHGPSEESQSSSIIPRDGAGPHDDGAAAGSSAGSSGLDPDDPALDPAEKTPVYLTNAYISEAKAHGKAAMQADTKAFAIRPLCGELVKYAAVDVRLLAPMRALWTQK